MSESKKIDYLKREGVLMMARKRASNKMEEVADFCQNELFCVDELWTLTKFLYFFREVLGDYWEKYGLIFNIRVGSNTKKEYIKGRIRDLLDGTDFVLVKGDIYAKGSKYHTMHKNRNNTKTINDVNFFWGPLKKVKIEVFWRVEDGEIEPLFKIG